MIIGATVVFTAVIVVTGLSVATNHDPAATPPRPGAVQLSFSDYKAGDCLLGDVPMNSTPWPDLMWRVPCTESHTYEVFYANFAYWPDKDKFPGTQAVQDQGTIECDMQFARYDGAQCADSVYTYTEVLPYPADNWYGSSHEVACIAFSPTAGHPDGDTITGSIKGSNR